MRAEIDELASEWLRPLTAGAPTGHDARHQPEYELLRAEVAKLTGMHHAPVDWSLVATVGTDLLTTRTKDLVIATHVACALHEQQGLRGLSRGLALLSGLIVDFGTTLHPSRLRARANALTWFAERCGDRIRHTNGHSAADLALVSRLCAVLVEVTRSNFGADGPSLQPLVTGLARLAVSIPVSPPDPAPVAATCETLKAAHPEPVSEPVFSAPHAPPLSLPPTPSSPADADTVVTAKFLRRAGATLVETAQMLRTADPRDPLPYRLLRTGLWLHWNALPAADSEGITRIPPPDRRAREAAENLLSHARWGALLDQSEGMAAQYPCWLDAHYLATQALRGLGEAFSAAETSLTLAVRGFVDRLPGLTSLRFSDGTPLAQADTLRWLQESALEPGLDGDMDFAWSQGGARSRTEVRRARTTPSHRQRPSQTGSDQVSSVLGPSLPPAEPTAGESSRFAEGLLTDELREGLRRGEASSLKQLGTVFHRLPSGRAAFLLRLELAELLRATGRYDLVLDLYTGLEQDLDIHGIERWEPELAIRVLGGLATILGRHATPQGVTHPDAARVRARLARLSPSTLL